MAVGIFLPMEAAMAAPFLPDPDDMAPSGAYDVHGTVDPHAHLMSLGYTQVHGPVDVAEVVERLAAGVPEGAPERWRITDDDVAEWAMAKYAQAGADLERIRRQRASYAKRIDQWYERSAAEALRSKAFFEAHLIWWALEQRSQSGGTDKTIKVPSGEVRTRKPGPWKPAIADPAALLEWALDARDHGTNIVRSRLILDVLVTALQTIAVVVESDDETADPVVVFAETGERIPGTTAKRTVSTPTVVAYETD